MGRVFLAMLFLTLTSYGQTTDQAAVGNQLFFEGRYPEAAAAFEKVPPVQRTAELLNRLGVSYHMVSRLKEAEAVYKLAVKMNDDHAGAQGRNIGFVEFCQNPKSL